MTIAASTANGHRTNDNENIEVGFVGMEEASPQQEQAQAQQDVHVNVDDNGDDGPPKSGGCCNKFGGLAEARGYNFLGIGRGLINMCNIFLGASLLYLASEAADCLELEDPDSDDDTMIPMSDCPNKVHGFTPNALVTNIAVISGLLSAFFMPVFGAILDYTTHRRTIGMVTSAIICIIQLVQIATFESTWFIMAILQAFVAFVFQIQVMVAYAYLPYMARKVDETSMTEYTRWFVCFQFICQMLFLLVVVIVTFGLGLDNVRTAHVGQALAGTIMGGLSWHAWTKLMPYVPPTKELRPGQVLVFASFQENYRTLKSMVKHYRRSLLWFHISLSFGEAGVVSLVPIAVTFCTDVLNMDGGEIGILFILALFGSLPGTWCANYVTQMTNPKQSWLLNFCVTTVVTASGAFVMKEGFKESGYIYGFLWGFCLGWFFPTKTLVFSRILPPGKDSQMSGFFVYAAQIFAWMPPLVFSALIEAGVPSQYGLLSLASFTFIAGLCTLGMASWPEVLEDVNKTIPDDDGEEGQDAVSDLPTRNKNRREQRGDKDDKNKKNGRPLRNTSALTQTEPTKEMSMSVGFDDTTDGQDEETNQPRPL